MLRNVERLAGRFSTSIIPVKEKAKKQLRIVFVSPLDNEFWHIIRKGVLYAKGVIRKKCNNRLLWF